MKINNIKELLVVIESDVLNDNQIKEVIESSMGLYLSDEELKLPKVELAKRVENHFNEYFTLGYKIVPLFLKNEN